MVDIVAPQVYPDGDVLGLKDALEIPGGVRLLPVALTAADDGLLVPEQLHIGVILREVDHVIHRGVHIDQLIHIIAEAVVGGVDAAEGQTAAEDVREAEIQIDGMGRAQTASKGDDARFVVPAVPLAGDVADLGHGFLHDVADPLLIAADAPVGVAVRVGPGLLVDGVDGEDHHLTGLDPRGQRIGHVEVLEVKKPAILAGDVEHRPAGVAIDLALHLAAERGAVILKILHFHRGSLLINGSSGQSSSYIRVWIMNGSCFSQLASLWVPPGTRRAVRWMPRIMTLLHMSAKPLRIPSWLPISREP